MGIAADGDRDARPVHSDLVRSDLADDMAQHLRGSKDADGKAEHVLSAFCVALDQSVGPVSSRGKGREIPDALRLIDQLDLTGKIVASARKQSLQRSWGRAAMMSCR